MYQLLFVMGAILVLPVLPILYLQGKSVRRRMPEPLAATGETFGTCTGKGEKMNLLVIGESTVEGVGVAHYEQTINAKIAIALSKQLERTVCWQAIGKIGAKVAFTRAHLLPLMDQNTTYEVIVILLGANDSIKLTPPASWQQALSGLIEDIQTIQPQALIYIATLPPVAQFPVLPQPTRFFLGLHNQLLVHTTRKMLKTQPGVLFSQLVFKNLPPDFFSEDGVHPSEKGYTHWASKIAEELAAFV